MEIQLHSQEFSLTQALRLHLARRMHFAFARVRTRIARVIVRLRDVNGPKGGRDKLCQVTVAIPGRPEIVVREMRDDIYQAIDAALKRAACSVRRNVERLAVPPQRRLTLVRQHRYESEEVNHG